MESENCKNDLYQAYLTKWRAREAEESERRSREGKIAIWLTPAPEDAATFTREHQVELHRVVGTLREQGVELEAPFFAVDSVDAVSGYSGQLVISLAGIAGPVITAALVAWLKGRPGRKVRVEFHPSGKLKTVEAQTDEQVLTLVAALENEAQARLPKSDSD